MTLTGRLGFAQDRWLVYVKGGAAWARETHQITVAQDLGGGFAQTASGKDNRFGWVFGVGAEVALWGNWTFKSEYNYIDMGIKSVQFDGTSTAAGVTTPISVPLEIQQHIHLTKVGLNYRFGPNAAPAVAPSPPVPGFDWGGSYVGLQVGYGFGQKTWPDFAPLDRFDVDGVVAGGTIGTNVQIGAFVLGAESELMWTGIRGGNSQTLDFGGLVQTTGVSTKVDWLSLSSVRVGFVAADRWLVYAKGGVALAHETHDINIAQTGVAGSVSVNTSGKALHAGYLVGVGTEYALFGNWTAKLEYNYMRFRQQNVTTTGTESFNAPPLVGSIALYQATSVRQDMHLLKFGVNYHFASIVDVLRSVRQGM